MQFRRNTIMWMTMITRSIWGNACAPATGNAGGVGCQWRHYQLLSNYQVEIDCCPSCDGVWLDHDEVEQVMHSPLLKDALADLNKKVSWKSWLFQFFTAMP